MAELKKIQAEVAAYRKRTEELEEIIAKLTSDMKECKRQVVSVPKCEECKSVQAQLARLTEIITGLEKQIEEASAPEACVGCLKLKLDIEKLKQVDESRHTLFKAKDEEVGGLNEQLEVLRQLTNNQRVEYLAMMNEHRDAVDGDLQRYQQELVSISTAGKPLNRALGGDFLDFIPEFNPDESNRTTKEWIEVVEDIKAAYGLTDPEIVASSFRKMVGSAKIWAESISKSGKTWTDWKNLLLENFPSIKSTRALREDAESYSKKDTISMTEYFHTKVTKCKRVGMTEEEVIDYLV